MSDRMRVFTEKQVRELMESAKGIRKRFTDGEGRVIDNLIDGDGNIAEDTRSAERQRD